jgi:RNA polymerase sigma factor (TIGR02999 family)
MTSKRVPLQSANENEVTELLERFSAGDPAASEKLLSLLYSELHRLAESFMRKQPSGHTLQATALVNEAFVRISRGKSRGWQDRAGFMSACARAMRCVLIDHARARRARPAAKLEPSALDMVLVSYENRVLDLLALDEALKKLAKFDARMAQAVELRFFAGLPMDEVARVLEIPKRTLEREWAATRVWLFEEMS